MGKYCSSLYCSRVTHLFGIIQDMWSNILEKYVIPKGDEVTGLAILGPIMDWFLSWVRFPNHTTSDPLGDIRTGELTCFVFNVPTLAMGTGGGISLAAIIYSLWVVGFFFALLSYCLYLLLMIPTAWYYLAQGQTEQDADLDALEEELVGMDDTDFQDINATDITSKMDWEESVYGPSVSVYTDPSLGPVEYYVVHTHHHKGE